MLQPIISQKNDQDSRNKAKTGKKRWLLPKMTILRKLSAALTLFKQRLQTLGIDHIVQSIQVKQTDRPSLNGDQLFIGKFTQST